jgi:DNA-binding HxlR family transcriptional regulator
MTKGIQRLRTAGTSKSMAAALNMFGQKWALRVIWELRVGPLNFRALQAACGSVSPSVLQRRLHELRKLMLIERIPRLGYRLSARGERLFQVLVMLNKWSGELRPAAQSDDKSS